MPGWASSRARWILRNPTHLRLVECVDVLGLLAMIVLVGSTFGWLPATILTLAFLAFPANIRFLGGSIKYDWLVAIAMVPVLLRRDRPGLAGAALGAAVCMRVFPAVFLLPFVVRGAVAAVGERRLPRRELRVAVGFAIVAAVGLVVGALPRGGMDRWRAFVPEIELHNREMRFGEGRVGLDHLFTFDSSGGGAPDRRDNLERQRWLARGTAGLLLALLLAALRRADETDAFVLSSVALFVLTVASHYYWSVLCLWALVGWGRAPPAARAWRVIGATVALLPTAVGWAMTDLTTGDYPVWIAVDATFLVLFVVALVYRIVSDSRPRAHKSPSQSVSAAA